MNNETKNHFIYSADEEELVLAAPTELFDEAEAIAHTTSEDEKFHFVVQYDSNQKEFLLSVLQTAGVIIEADNEDEHMLSTHMNMTQLDFVKRMDCVERVKSDEGINPFLSEKEVRSDTLEATAAQTAAPDTTSQATMLFTDELAAEISATNEASVASICNCPTNTDMASAQAVSVEALVNGCICCPGAEQWFKFTVPKTATYTIYTMGPLDTVGSLYDNNGNKLVEVDDYEPCGKLNFRIIRYLTVNRTYYIRVREANTDTGSYNLKITQNKLVEGLSITPSTVVLEVGKTYELPITPNYIYKGYNGAQRISDLSVSISPSNADEQKIWWWEEYGDVLECSYGWDDDGDRYIHVTATKIGTAKLYAQDWNENGKMDECTVTVVTPYESMLQKLCGFSSEEIGLILKLYEKVEAVFISENAYQKAWRSARLLSEFSYDGYSYFFGIPVVNKWDNVAGSVTKESNRKAYFMDTLGFTENEYEKLEQGLKNQHESADAEHIFNDFTHLQYSLAARLAYSLNKDDKLLSNLFTGLYTGNEGAYSDEDISYLGGWFGDAVLKKDGGTGTPSFGNDDYMADLDAENIYRLIIQGSSSIDAINAYYTNMTLSNTRATIFLQNIPYDIVKEKIFHELIDADLYGLWTLYQDAHDEEKMQYVLQLIRDEQYHYDTIKSQCPDTYDFMRSLEDQLETMNHYQ